MTLEELIALCNEAEEAQAGLEKPARFAVFVPEARYGRTVRIAPGLSGLNYGHYPKGTMVSLEVPKVRKWIKSVQKEKCDRSTN